MSGPSSAPRGEQPGRVGARWETELRWPGEAVLLDDDWDAPDEWAPEDRPARAVRRRAAREARRST